MSGPITYCRLCTKTRQSMRSYTMCAQNAWVERTKPSSPSPYILKGVVQLLQPIWDIWTWYIALCPYVLDSYMFTLCTFYILPLMYIHQSTKLVSLIYIITLIKHNSMCYHPPPILPLCVLSKFFKPVACTNSLCLTLVSPLVNTSATIS